MKLKSVPEDFIVKEKSNIVMKEQGDFAYFKLKKKNYNTLSAIETLAKIFNISTTRFSFAGNKDKVAITEQLVSVKGIKKEQLEQINLTDIDVAFLGYGDKYIHIGELEGNEFTITIRNITEEEKNNFETKTKNIPILFPNYFGEQRFSEQNAEVGRAIIKRDFEKATELLKLPIIENNYIGAIRETNKKILKLYIHAYQSLIFNETIKIYLKKKRENEKIPIVGFGTELENYNKELQNIIKKILDKEKIDLRAFITVKIPELSEEGTERQLFTEIENLEILEQDDKVKIKFFLKKGCYATEAINYLFN